MSAETHPTAEEPSASRRGAARRPGPLVRARIYYREIVAELRKVIYPTRSELVTYTLVVLIFVTAMVSLVAGLDYGFTRLDTAVFG